MRIKAGIIIFFVCALLLIGGCGSEKQAETGAAANTEQNVAKQNAVGQDSAATDAQLKRFFETQARDVQIAGAGTVTRLLSDDNDGSRHQRFIVALSSGQTLLIVHNIDIAPRVQPLQVGDTVEFNGEYVYNAEGGLIHWTHRDPNGSHIAGYIIVNGKKFS